MTRLKQNSKKFTGVLRCTSSSKMKLVEQNQINNYILRKLKKKDNPKTNTALASFPGSGSTWMRYLLQQSTGIWTGSIYNDEMLKKTGFAAEHVTNSSVLFIKTHKYEINDMKRFDRVVLLVRNPADAILSEFNRQSAGHTGHATLDEFTGKNKKSLYVKFEDC